MSRRQKWLIACSVCASIALVALFVASRILSRRFEPYIRAQAIEYLAKRFDSHVELTALRVRLPGGSPQNTLEVFIHAREGQIRLHGSHTQVFKHPRRPAIRENPHTDSRISPGKQPM